MTHRSTRTLIGLVAGSLAVSLAACGGGSEPAEASGSAAPGDLEVFSWWTSGSESAALSALFDAYTSANDGSEVVNGAVAGGGGGNAQAVLQTRLQGGDAPDVWQTHPGAAINEYITAGLVTDLSSVYAENGLADVVPAAMLEAISSDGKQYGVSVGAHRGNVLWYSIPALEEAGVSVPADDYTTEAFLADLATLDAAGVTPLCLGAKDTFAVAELFENTLLGNGGAGAWDELTSDGGDWEGEQVRTAAEQFGQMLEYADPDASALSWDQATKKLAAGECAFESMGDWAYGELVNSGAEEGVDFGYTAHPGSDGAFMAVVDTLVVADAAENKDAALQFMADIMTPEAQLAFNKEKGSTPLRTDVDVSSLPTYQQAAAGSFKTDDLTQSIVHGSAMNPQFAQALNDAVTQFAQAKDVDSLTLALSSAAAS